MYPYSYLLGKSSKIDKSDKYTDYENFIMYLAPHKVSGYNMCPNASPGCAASCLNTSGHGRWEATQNARINRTLHYVKDRMSFIQRLVKEVTRLQKRYDKLAIRLNGTSDINWMPIIRRLHTMYPNIVFYDYTKNPKFALDSLNVPFHHVTFSRSEDNDDDCKEVLKHGINVAVVFRKKLPKTFWGYPVIDGDETDARFLDSQGCIIGLRAKGEAKKDTTGFVVDID